MKLIHALIFYIPYISFLDCPVFWKFDLVSLFHLNQSYEEHYYTIKINKLFTETHKYKDNVTIPASNDMWGPDGLTTGSMGTVWAWALAG